MDFQTILALVGGAAAAFFGSKMLVAGDSRVEDRRRQAITLSTWCAANGLPTVSSLLADYAVGDYSGVLAHIRQLAQLIASPEQTKAVVQQFLDNQLTKALSTEEGKAALLSKVETQLGIKINRDALVVRPTELTTAPVVTSAPAPAEEVAE